MQDLRPRAAERQRGPNRLCLLGRNKYRRGWRGSSSFWNNNAFCSNSACYSSNSSFCFSKGKPRAKG